MLLLWFVQVAKKVLESLKFKTCYFRALKIVEMCRSPGKPHKSPGISVFAGRVSDTFTPLMKRVCSMYKYICCK